MKAITTKQTNSLVPIGAKVNIRYSGDDKCSFIYDNQWFGDYHYSCFKAKELLSDKSAEYLDTLGYVNSLMGFENNSYENIAKDSNCNLISNSLFK